MSQSKSPGKLEIYEYQIVKFDDESVDVLPNVWIKYDYNSGCMTAKYMSPPYNESCLKTLNRMIQLKIPPSVDPVLSWPYYNISLIGQAKSLEEGEEKIRLFHSTYNRKRVVFTEDSDYTPEEKAKKIEEKFRQMQQNNNVDILKVQRIESDTSNSSHESSEGENDCENLFKKKKKQIVYVGKKTTKSNNGKRKRSSSSDENDNTDITLSSLSGVLQKNSSSPTSIKNDNKRSGNVDGVNINSLKNKNFGEDAFFEKLNQISSENRAISQQVKEFDYELSEAMTRMRRIEQMLETVLEKMGMQTNRGFAVDNNLNLPFEEYEEFKAFDEKLFTDQEFQKNFVNAVTMSHFDQRTKKNISEKAVSDGIGIVLSNVKDWEGGRKMRKTA
ncbi:uncharacterized protein LOC122499613 [Leptopilina heterotoma]|uniref:uncharacterized protein LOC122499613 n=1 Tax=Leptopilina heterotoma TaxID=63436 RepID=UPI001CA87CBD|nr:uncharacterized protein LOC122499613 [Leptopilina heterotoma]